MLNELPAKDICLGDIVAGIRGVNIAGMGGQLRPEWGVSMERNLQWGDSDNGERGKKNYPMDSSYWEINQMSLF